MVYYSIGKYLKALLAWTQQPASIHNGKIWINGQGYTSAEFYAANPKPRFENAVDENNPGKPLVSHGCKTKKSNVRSA